MELWIRSQNKRTLRKVNDLYISPLGCLAGKDELYWIVDESIKLGGYKTKERTLEVLDEIQNHISNINDKENGNEYYPIFIMPQE